MGRWQRLAAKGTWIVATMAATAIAYVALTSLTRPFTLEADVAIALPLVAAVPAAALRIRAARKSDPAIPRAETSRAEPASRRWSLLWVALTLVIAGWELYSFTGSPRSAHPTLSTLIDLLDSTRIGKFAAIAVWLAAGWYLVRQ
jgi:hypothetical protein